MIEYIQKIILITFSGLKSEFRVLRNLLTMLIFSLSITFIFSLTFDFEAVQRSVIIPQFLWLVIVFSAFIETINSQSPDEDKRLFAGIYLATGDKSCIFFARSLINFSMLTILELLLIPIYLIMNNFTGMIDNISFILTIFFGSWGLILIITLMASLTTQMRSNMVIVLILAFPMILPLLISVIMSTNIVFGIITGEWLTWLYLLFFFDLVFMILPVIFSEYLP